LKLTGGVNLKAASARLPTYRRFPSFSL